MHCMIQCIALTYDLLAHRHFIFYHLQFSCHCLTLSFSIRIIWFSAFNKTNDKLFNLFASRKLIRFEWFSLTFVCNEIRKLLNEDYTNKTNWCFGWFHLIFMFNSRSRIAYCHRSNRLIWLLFVLSMTLEISHETKKNLWKKIRLFAMRFSCRSLIHCARVSIVAHQLFAIFVFRTNVFCLCNEKTKKYRFHSHDWFWQWCVWGTRALGHWHTRKQWCSYVVDGLEWKRKIKLAEQKKIWKVKNSESRKLCTCDANRSKCRRA